MSQFPFLPLKGRSISVQNLSASMEYAVSIPLSHLREGQYDDINL